MDWILAPWIVLLASGWLLALMFHAAYLLPARAQRGEGTPRG